MAQNDTIYALASAHGMAGVAVIRLSGPKAIETALQLSNCKTLRPRYAEYSILKDLNGEIIDTAIVLTFPNPGSFTGEDVVEFQLHGSPAIIKRMGEVLEQMGLRLANPGEFTRRAFENDKMNLLQAEGLLDLIHAETEAQRKLALKFSGADVSNTYSTWRQNLVEALAYIEASIDFADDELPEDLEQRTMGKIKELHDTIATHLNNDRGQAIIEGFTIAIIGAPNAGKSSLFNALLGTEKAIISSRAGTTRDVIEATLDIKGYKVILADTAGLRETADEIEEEGIKRALAKAENADLNIYVVADEKIEEKYLKNNTILVLNKDDIITHTENGIKVSAKTGAGLEELHNTIENEVLKRMATADQTIFTRARHKKLLQETILELQHAIKVEQLDLSAEHVRHAADALGQITGHIGLEELLDKIFGDFCLGK